MKHREDVSFFDRHADKISIGGSDECWLWTGAKNHKGYGYVKVKGRMLRVHRVAHEEAIGPIEHKLLVLHSCDTPACVNPKHLRAGTQKENMQDRENRGRTLKGETSPRSKLTEQQVLEIRARRSVGEPREVLAQEFGVSIPHISDIALGKSWVHTVKSPTETRANQPNGRA